MHQWEVLKRPILTEKTTYLSDVLHRYTFEVDRRANKHQIREAIKAIFDVEVLDVNVMNVRGKKRRFGRHVGQTSNWRKAVVTVAPGETISFFEGV